MYKILLIIIFLTSCGTVEERIKSYSYTSIKYNKNGEFYQVYRTKKGTFYILELNKNETNFKRTYLKIK